MAIITFPSTILVSSMRWGELRNDVASRSVFGSQTIQVAEPWWKVSVTFEKMDENEFDELLGVLMALRGQENQLSLWNFGRPIPRGTMRGSPVLSSAIVAGTTTLPITGGTAFGTLRVGDMLGVGAGLTRHVFMVQAPITLDASGAGSVSVLPPSRSDFAISTVVRWDKPQALFRRTNNLTEWEYSTNIVDNITIDLIEDPRT